MVLRFHWQHECDEFMSFANFITTKFYSQFLILQPDRFL